MQSAPVNVFSLTPSYYLGVTPFINRFVNERDRVMSFTKTEVFLVVIGLSHL